MTPIWQLVERQTYRVIDQVNWGALGDLILSAIHTGRATIDDKGATRLSPKYFIQLKRSKS